MDTKALKKQMGAAIAMVLVAAIALGSATFAWFVNGNTAKATTSAISAQSNAAFMYIHNANDMQDKDHSEATTEVADGASMFPAHWVTSTESQATSGDFSGQEAGKFYTAFGSDATRKDMRANTLALVKCDNETETAGTPAAAEKGITPVGGSAAVKYAVKNTFYIGSKGANLTDLLVAGATIGTGANGTFDSALRVLVTCDNAWVLCNKDGIVASSDAQTTGKIADTVSETEKKVDVYVFYDGDDAAVYTNNLPSLKTASNKITVSFSATSQDTSTSE